MPVAPSSDRKAAPHAERGRAPERRGRYLIHDIIASGGMGTVYFAELQGAADFARIVSAKRLHAQFAAESEFVTMFQDEARLSSRISHPNVVAPIDVIEAEGELLVIFDYVHGESLSKLLKPGQKGQGPPSLGIVSAIVSGLLRGLHAAHVATAKDGEPLAIIHRDVSPQNVLVGADGVARLIDFGVAKARTRLQSTREGELKGKLAYMAPELLRGRGATRQTDIYAAAVVLWEAATGKRLFTGENEGAIVEQVLVGLVDPPSKYVDGAPEALDAVVLRALEREPSDRFATAAEMADALARAVPPAPPDEVANWVRTTAAAALAHRAGVIAAIQAGSRARVETSSSLPLRRRPLLLAFALGVALVAAGGSALLLRPRPPPAPDALPRSSPSVSAGGPTAPPEATTSLRPGEATSASGASRAARPASRGAPLPLPFDARGPKPGPDCALPYKLDADGRKVYKRECL